MVEQLIIDILNERPLKIESIDEGITNQDYLVTLPTKKVVLRVPYASNKDIMNYHLEAQCLQLIEPYQLDVPLLYYDENTGIKISLFIEDLKTFTENNNLSAVEEVAKLLRKFHHLPVRLHESFDVLGMVETFKHKTKSPRYTFSFEEELLSKLKHYEVIDTLCHNDLVGGNLCFGPDRSYLIDFEYAKDNDAYFDLASFITENDIQDEARRSIFFKHYFEQAAFDQEKFDYYEQLLYYFWCLWSMMNETLSDDPIFKTITDLKAQRLYEKRKTHQI